MNFSWHQWAGIIVLDVLMRAAFFFVANPLSVFIALELSLLNLSLLVLVNFFVEPFKLRAVAAAAIIIVATNILFLIATYAYSRSCCSMGIQAVAGFIWYTLALPINIIPFLMMWALNPLRRKKTT